MRYIFGDSMLDTQQYELCHARSLVKLRPKVFQLLLYLITHRDRVVPKQELTAALWPDQSISEATLDSCLAEARQAIGDSGRSQRVIQTRYGYGYRFVAPVEVQSDPVTSVDDAELSSPTPGAAVETTRGRASMPGESPLAAALSSGQHELEPLRPPLPWLLAGEHKMVTVLVCMLVHATRGASRHEAEAWHQVRQTVLALMQDEVAHYEGTLQEVLEDSVLVLFGAPVAQEDHAQRAVQAALSLRERLAR